MSPAIRVERFLVGLRGLGLLRNWPFGDAADADRELEAIAATASRTGDPVEMDFIDVLGAYTDWAEVYDEPNALIALEEVALRGLVRDVPPGRALDVACGTGRVAAVLAELGHEVIGCDPTTAMLERARAKGIPQRSWRATSRCSPQRTPRWTSSPVRSRSPTSTTSVPRSRSSLVSSVRAGGSSCRTSTRSPPRRAGTRQLKRADGSRAVTRNHVHWPSEYVRAATAAGLVVEACEEPRVSEPFFEALTNPEVLEIARSALEGLPYALLWKMRKVGPVR